MPGGEPREIGGVTVHGLDLDGETRCAHYDSPRDVVAIRFACCGELYPCYRCHDAVTDHERGVWPASAREEQAILCGACGRLLSIEEYLSTDDSCPACDTDFNPGCREHHDRYFAPELTDS